MKKEEKVKGKAAFGTAAALALVFMIMSTADRFIPFSPERNPALRGYPFAANSMLFSFIILGLTVYLTYIYLKDYLVLRSRFTLAILFAVFAFMVYAVASNPLVQMFFGIGESMSVLVIIQPVLIAVALAALAWASSK
ncbi:MAG: hypothetical protein WC607_02490 [Candidatus Micrarchaeia archaeon]